MSKKKEVTIEEKLKEALISKEEQPYEIPNNWEWINLSYTSDFINGDRGKNYPSKNDFETAGIPFINAGNLQNGEINTEYNYISKKKYDSLKSGKIRKGDILYCLRGSLGKLGLVEEELEGAIASSLVIIRCSKLIKNKFLLKFLKTPLSQKLISYFNNGTAQPNLSVASLKKFTIVLPPLEEQERIVNKLDSMLGRINEAKELIAQAKETFGNRRASILNLAFSGELTRKWRESNSIESSKILLENLNKEKIRLWEEECEKALEEGKKKPSKPKLLSMDEMLIPKEEQPYKIPESWECVKLEGIIEHTTNLDIQKKLDKNETINYVDIESINNKLFKINTIKEKKVSELSTRARRVLKKGYMMYSLVRPYLNNFALIEEEKENFIGSTGFAVFKSKVSPIKYIFYYMQTNYIKEYYQSFLKGFNSPSITIENFNSTSIPLPPLEEQKEIVRILDNVLEKEDKINEILELEEMIELLEKSILDKAFRGELGTGNLEDIPSLEVLKNILEK